MNFEELSQRIDSNNATFEDVESLIGDEHFFECK